MEAHTSSTSKPGVLAPEIVAYGAVHLDVTDGGRALGFWHDIVGLSQLESEGEELHLGAGGRELVVLHPGAERGVARGHSGLYHLAIHLPDETEFARVLWRLIVAGYPHAPTDHTMSKSTYLTDPDGLGVELALETPERLGSWTSEPSGPRVIDVEETSTASPRRSISTRCWPTSPIAASTSRCCRPARRSGTSIFTSPISRPPFASIAI